MRAYELTPSPGDPVLVEPIWIVPYADPQSGDSVLAECFGTLEAAQKWIEERK